MPSRHLLFAIKGALSAALMMMCVLAAQAQTPAPQAAPPTSPELVEASKLAAQVVDLYSKGRYDDALPLARRALDLREKALGPDHPLVGEALYNLASLQLGKKNYDDAQSLYKRTLKIFEKAYGREDIKLATTLDNLGYLYVAASAMNQAEDAFLRALAIREKALGAEHDEVSESTYRLAQLYERLGRYGKAVDYYKRTLAIKEKSLGPASKELIPYLEKCACALSEDGQKEESARLHDRIQDIRYQGRPQAAQAVKGGVLQGRATNRAEPIYPMAARQKRITGSVTVEVTVDETGRVLSARALCGPPLLRATSVEAARNWRFTPTTVEGVPVKVIGTITFNFRM